MSGQRHQASGPNSRGVGWTWVTPRNCSWKSRVIVREFWVLCHEILPTEAVLEVQHSSSFISRPLWDYKKHGLLHRCSRTRQGGMRLSCQHSLYPCRCHQNPSLERPGAAQEKKSGSAGERFSSVDSEVNLAFSVILLLWCT